MNLSLLQLPLPSLSLPSSSFTSIRVRVGSSVIQGTFGLNETSKDVLDFAIGCLDLANIRDPSNEVIKDFFLFSSPPKKEISVDVSLLSLSLYPSALLYLGRRSNLPLPRLVPSISPSPSPSSSLLPSISTFASASVVQETGNERKWGDDTKMEQERQRLSREKETGGREGERELKREMEREGVESQRGNSTDRPIPKWFRHCGK